MNIALAGTTCGQLLTLFKFTFGYPESQESKERVKTTGRAGEAFQDQGGIA